ncbi:MAG: hypothetical protein HY347_00850 [candidate division NC10 bacterium]|nr:hypothetical protein [candidate division NC10 bacterium]
MATREEKYRQAALAYLIYGLIYLVGALYLAHVGVAERAVRGGSSGWFLLGGLFVIAFPWLIFKGFKWFTRALVLLLLLRIGGLIKVIVGPEGGKPVPMPGGWEMPMALGAAIFLLVAAATCYMLARAAWDL